MLAAQNGGFAYFNHEAKAGVRVDYAPESVKYPQLVASPVPAGQSRDLLAGTRTRAGPIARGLPVPVPLRAASQLEGDHATQIAFLVCFLTFTVSAGSGSVSDYAYRVERRLGRKESPLL
jgi:hypothetical protein